MGRNCLQTHGIVSMGKISPTAMRTIQEFRDYTVIHTNDAIIAEAARIRASSFINPPKMLLPDALILATANATGRLLVTRNKKDFRGSNVRFPYELQDSTIFNIAVPPAQ